MCAKLQPRSTVDFSSPSRFDAALQEAAQVDKLIEEETGGEEVLEDRLPLLGVPLSVKGSFALQGTIQKWNSYSLVETKQHLKYSDNFCQFLLSAFDMSVLQACPSLQVWSPGDGSLPPLTLLLWPT